MSTENQSRLKKFSEWLRHPLILVLITSVLIPFLVYWLQARKSLTDSRQAKALTIVTSNAEFEGYLDALFTELGSFNSQNRELLKLNCEIEKLDPARRARQLIEHHDELSTLKDRRDKFQEKYATSLTEFNKKYSDRNLWVDDLLIEGVILKLFSAEDLQSKSNDRVASFREHIETYRKNLINSKTILNLFFDLLVGRSKYDPEEIAAESGECNSLTDCKSLTGKYNFLHSQRQVVVNQFVTEVIQ